MTKESRLPGLWLRQLAERVFDRERLERVVLPALADLQHECGDSAGFVVRLRAYWGVSKAMAICALADVYHQARPTCGNVAKRMAVILPLVMCAVMLPLLNTAFDGRNSPTVVLLTLSPQAFAAALLVAYFFAVTLEQWPTSPRRLLPAICAMSTACTLVMLILTMTIVPRANQVFRSSLAERLTALGRASALAPPGPAEWTFTDLLDRAAGTSPTDQALARKQLTSRLTTATLPIMLGFLALGISGYSRKIALFSGVWVLVLYFAALRAAAPSSYRAPSIESVWLVNAVFTLAGLWLVWIRPRPDDTGPESRLPMP